MLGADQIVVMDQGRIVQAGTHAELLADNGGLYRQLYDCQLSPAGAADRTGAAHCPTLAAPHRPVPISNRMRLRDAHSCPHACFLACHLLQPTAASAASARSWKPRFSAHFAAQMALALEPCCCSRCCCCRCPGCKAGSSIGLCKSPRSEPRRVNRLAWLLIAAAAIPLACLLGRMALSWFSSGVMNRVSLQFVRALTDSLHRKLQRLPLAFFDRQETGQLMARLTNDVGTLLIFLSASSLQLMADLVLALGIFVGLLTALVAAGARQLYRPAAVLLEPPPLRQQDLGFIARRYRSRPPDSMQY